MTSSPLDARVEALADDFALLDSWEERMSHVIDIGRRAPSLAEPEKVDANKVRGCASQVWIVAEPSPVVPGGLRFRGQSDAAIVQGLVAVLMEIYSDAVAADILALDANAAMARLGLSGALTAQRANGLSAMIKVIRSYAHAAQTTA